MPLFSNGIIRVHPRFISKPRAPQIPGKLDLPDPVMSALSSALNHPNHHSRLPPVPDGTAAAGPAKSAIPLPSHSSQAASQALPTPPPSKTSISMHSTARHTTSTSLTATPKIPDDQNTMQLYTSSLSISISTTSGRVPSQDGASVSNDANDGHNTAGIAIGVTFALALTIILAGLVWFFRRRKEQERRKWRDTWKRGFETKTGEKTRILDNDLGHARDDAKVASSDTPFPSVSGSQPNSLEITTPPNSFNNSSSYTPISTPLLSPVIGTNGLEMANVRRGFLPSLPDELPVDVGEAIQVMSIYDDGWCLCRNGRGESGMVPQECLARVAHQQNQMIGGHDQFTGTIDARLSRRASSLYGGISSEGVY